MENHVTVLPERLIVRPKYLNKALTFREKGMIKIFTGQRRVGKSYLLFQLIQYFIRENANANILYINKELNEFNFIRNSDDLVRYVIQNEKDADNYLFIDEVQEILDFEKGLRSLLASQKWDIWCSGSNAQMLSGDIAGLLSGRFVEIRVHGLNYSEFMEFNQLEENASSFQKFIKYGGLPYISNLSLTDGLVFEYLKGIYNTILFKDVVSRYKLRNIYFLENLVSFAADNVGNMLSAKKISDFLKSQGIKMAPNIVLDYLSYLTESYVLNRIRRADITGKRIFEIGEKYYFEDLGLRHSILGFRSNDIGKILENVVLLHLHSMGYLVTTGDIVGKEIDFVCDRGSERIYVQVAYLIVDDKVSEREFGNLLAIPDNYPKYVVSMDEIEGNSVKGINHLNVRKFLSREL